jgi:hypothetical protein
MSERFEQTDVSSGLVARAGAYLALAVAVIFVAIYLFLHLLGGHSPAPHIAGPEALTPEWGESVPADYHWINRKQNIIAIPIDRAIDLTVERGLLARPKP